eukprot:6463333-Pyramimonas_sp.AAC.1
MSYEICEVETTLSHARNRIVNVARVPTVALSPCKCTIFGACIKHLCSATATTCARTDNDACDFVRDVSGRHT